MSAIFDPAQTGAHDVLAVLYDLTGDQQAAQHHRDMSEQIAAFLQQFEGAGARSAPSIR